MVIRFATEWQFYVSGKLLFVSMFKLVNFFVTLQNLKRRLHGRVEIRDKSMETSAGVDGNYCRARAEASTRWNAPCRQHVNARLHSCKYVFS